MNTNIKRLLLILISTLMAFSVASCGTLHGIGHDVETVGDNIQDAGN